MQVSNYTVGQHLELPIQKAFENENIVSRKINNHQKNKLPRSFDGTDKRYQIIHEGNQLRRIQNDFNVSLKLDSYLHRLQKVLERFKEENRKIADETMNQDSNRRNVDLEALNEIKGIENEFPMVQQITQELGNLFIKSIIGTQSSKDEVSVDRKTLEKQVDVYLSQIADRRTEINQNLEALDKLISNGSPSSKSNEDVFAGMREASQSTKLKEDIHFPIVTEKTINLLA